MRIFFVILLIGILGYSQLVAQAADIALPEIGDSAGAIISPQEEYQIGQTFFWRLQQSVVLIEDPEINNYIRSLGYRLVANSDAPQLHFTFFMVKNPVVNAFAAPGGFIGVHSGLMLTTQSEDELASVMAHEIAHITQRHLLRSFEKSKQVNIATTIGMVAAVLLGIADPKAGSAALFATQAGGVQAQLNFTRENESEADNLGMLTLVRAGFNAQAMPAFFERLQKASRYYGGGAVPEFLRTHPVTTSRIADARGRAVTYPVKRQLADNLQYYLMREKLRVITATNLNELVQAYANSLKKGNSLNQAATRYGYSLALTKNGNTTQARKEILKLIDNDEDRLSYQLALADIEITLGHYKSALKIYQDNQRLYPDDYALTIEQVSALLQVNLPEQAVKLLQRQLDLGAPTPQVYRLLAQAKGDLGEKSQAHSWLAEYYYASGQLEQAADQLRLAASFAKNDEYQLAKISAKLRKVEVSLAQMEEL